MPATNQSTKSLKAPKRAVSTPQSTFETEIRQQAERVAEAYKLLAEIEQRSESLTPAGIRVRGSEKRFLDSTLPKASKNLHTLGRELEKCRGVRQLLDGGATRQAVLNAAEEAEAACKAEKTAFAPLAALEDEEPNEIAEQIVELREKLGKYREARKSAERKLSLASRDYNSLLSQAPTELREAIKTAIIRLHETPDARRLKMLESTIPAVTRRIEQIARGKNAWVPADMHLAYLERECPKAIGTTIEGRRYIDFKTLFAHGEHLRETKLPALEAERETLAKKVADAELECREPLHEWAKTGKLTAEQLLAAL